METTVIILSIVNILLLGVCVLLWKKTTAITALFHQKSTEAMMLANEVERLKADAVDAATDNAALTSDVARLQQEMARLAEDKARLEERLKGITEIHNNLKEEQEAQFKVLAGKIFDDNSKAFRETNESRLDEILKPLKEKLAEFKSTVESNHVESAKERTRLEEQIRLLMAQNQAITKEAKELSQALTGNSKVQGDWGEMVLETILKKSGLVKDEHYFVQQTRQEDGSIITNDDNRQLRPDVVVKLPDNKYIVIDSKVSLTAYVSYINADTEEERNAAGKAHIASVRKHLKELEDKKYQDNIGIDKDSRLDYVLMFIPNEHAYMTAMALDSKLWMDAYDMRVVIISPAHVLSTLRLIAQLWSRDKQTKNALDIAEQGGRLYDKFVGFVNDMKDIDDAINRTRKAYDSAFNKLQKGKGNLLSSVEKLKTLGAKATKSLPAATDD